MQSRAETATPPRNAGPAASATPLVDARHRLDRLNVPVDAESDTPAKDAGAPDRPTPAVRPVAEPAGKTLRPAPVETAMARPAAPTVPVPLADVPEPGPTSASTDAAPPAPAPTPAPVRVPLRELAEWTSRSPDAPATVAGSTLIQTGPSSPASPPTGAPFFSTTAPAPAVEAVPQISGGPATDDESRPEPALPGAEPAPGSQTPSLREAALTSTLSRATVEATVQIAAQIHRRLEGRSTRFEMALTPDELGRVDVRLDIDTDGRLAARLAFDNPAAAMDLRGRADELRRQLEAAGFQMTEDAFEFTERDSGSSAFDRGQNARQDPWRKPATAVPGPEIDVAQPPRWMALSLSPAGVDMKV